MTKLPEIVDLHIGPPTFMLAGPTGEGPFDPGENRLIVRLQAEVQFKTDPGIRGHHNVSFGFSLAAADTVLTAPLPHLELLAYESGAELLEAIASELRKTAAG